MDYGLGSPHNWCCGRGASRIGTGLRGILVREGQSTTSKQLAERLSTGHSDGRSGHRMNPRGPAEWRSGFIRSLLLLGSLQIVRGYGEYLIMNWKLELKDISHLEVINHYKMTWSKR